MVRCSLVIPIGCWKLKEDIWDFMTLSNWLFCRGKDCDVISKFMSRLNEKLNSVSSNTPMGKQIWSASVNKTTCNLTIFLDTTQDTISISDFSDIIKSTIIPMLNDIRYDNEPLLFSYILSNKDLCIHGI